MRILATLICTLTAINTSAQIDFKSDTIKDLLFPEIVNKIDNFSQEFDFQLRVWSHGGITLPDKKDLFIMSLKNDK